MPWSTTEISTMPASDFVETSTVESSPEYATAFATRLATAARICSSLPRTFRSCTPLDDDLDATVVRVDGRRVDGSGDDLVHRHHHGASSGSSSWSRDSSMICCTRRDRRSDSVSIRPANRRTATGSSAASHTASASSLIAPTGVLSSWETLATKSRRTVSTRRSRVRSSTRASTSVEVSGATRTVTWRGAML